MATKFARLKPTKPIGEVEVDYTFWDLEDEPVLTVRTIADPNKDYRNAMMARANQSRRRVKGNRRDDAAAMDRLQHDLDMEIFPKYVITGWKGVKEDSGKESEFKEANVRDFLIAIDEIGLFSDLRAFCATVTNFMDVDVPDPDELAGNLPPA